MQVIPKPAKESPVHQLWRWVRLIGITFGHAAWVGLLGLHSWPSKTAIIGALVGASEVTYRTAFPTGSQRIGAVIGSLLVKGLADAPALLTPTPAPASNTPAGAPAPGPAAGTAPVSAPIAPSQGEVL